jgi:hypothetical protein
MPRFKNVRTRGLTLVFKFEEDYPDLLHIWARHRKTEQDAMFIFFNGKTRRNDEHDCWETKFGTEILWWFWIEENKVVMIISCFDE